jgi:hypothetical protein
MTKEVLKLALEALESSDKLINGSGNHFGLEGAIDGYYSGCFDVGGNNKLLNKAITAIKEALAESEQEPVAYGTWDTMLGKARMMMVRLDKGQDGCTVPLYTTPPQRKPLSNEEIYKIYRDCGDLNVKINIARAIEAALGIKE